MIEKEGFYTPQHKNGGKEHIIYPAEDTATSVDLIRLRLEGILDETKGALSHVNDPGAESSRKLYFCARGIDTLLRYLSESGASA